MHSFDRITRRDALKSGAVLSGVLGTGHLAFLNQLRPVSAEEAQVDPKIVQFDPSIEPLVRVIEDTPRERLMEEVAHRVQAGLSYQQLLAALLLAGVRNVEPRPSVGFKFHAVLVVNSAHLASLASQPQQRWLPIFWALDYFKSAQAQDQRERGWTMPPVDEKAVPPAHKALATFQEAMQNWDESAADAAIAGLARSAGANEVYEQFFRLGARDFRSIGHKAIFVANSCRTLQCIGWQYSEPVLRSLAYALLMHEGDNPAKRDAEEDRPYRRNLELVTKITPEWRDGQLDQGATNELLHTLRQSSPDDACNLVVEILNRGVSPQSVWDALFLQSGELLMRQPGIVSLHTVTTTNAMRYAYQASGDDETRRLLMLQNAAFLPMFREAMKGRGRVGDAAIDELQPQQQAGSDQENLDEIFRDIGREPQQAAAKALSLLNKNPQGAEEMIDAARVLIFKKGNDAHDYKFSSAVLEDYYHISPGNRDRFLAASVYKLAGTNQRDNQLVQRIEAAFA